MKYQDITDDIQEIMEKLPSVKVTAEGRNVIIHSDGKSAMEAYYQVCEISQHYYKFFTVLAKNQLDEGLLSQNEYDSFENFMKGILVRSTID